MNKQYRLMVVLGTFLLLTLVSLTMLTVQAQNDTWNDSQQRFVLHTKQLEQEGRYVQAECANPDVPVDIRVAAWYTHWHASSALSEELLYLQDWQAQKENLDPRVHVVDWEAFHSAVVTGNIKTVYYLQPAQTWFDVWVGCFYALDGRDIYILFDGGSGYGMNYSAAWMHLAEFLFVVVLSSTLGTMIVYYKVLKPAYEKTLAGSVGNTPTEGKKA